LIHAPTLAGAARYSTINARPRSARALAVVNSQVRSRIQKSARCFCATNQLKQVQLIRKGSGSHYLVRTGKFYAHDYLRIRQLRFREKMLAPLLAIPLNNQTNK